MKNLLVMLIIITSIVFLVFIAGRLSLSDEPALALIPAGVLIGGVLYYVKLAVSKDD